MRLLSYLFFLLIMACGGGGDSDRFISSSPEYVSDVAKLEEMVIEELATPIPAEQKEQKIIKTGILRFETGNVNKAHEEVLEYVRQNNGFVQSDQTGKGYNQLYYNMTVRIPTTNFQKTVDAIATNVESFDEKTISRRDVTEEFVDIEARLKAKHALEARYTELLKKANNVKELLEIERELANIREEIEARQGRLEYLKNQVSMSTLNIYFYKTTSETGVTVSYGLERSQRWLGRHFPILPDFALCMAVPYLRRRRGVLFGALGAAEGQKSQVL